MKTLFFISLLGALPFVCCIPNEEGQSTEQQVITEGMKLKITIGDRVLTATLHDNPTSRDFLSMLPITTTLEDYAGMEKIFYPDRKLSTEGAPGGFDPSPGDITYYAPWGNIAIFHKDFGYASGLISLGRIDNNGVEQLRAAGGEEVTFEWVERE
ncbi:MAG: hypothetical protein J5I94_08550 [Phaeodactylibacter sp.]|nr:hypothetical protein [Phaeodactylibacter sp.]